ncbi:MAG: PAS domain-containing protein [Puniceicoccaceae bacterium]
MDIANRFKSSHSIGKYLILLSLGWSLVVVVSLTWNYISVRSEMLEEAKINARSSFNKDLVYRMWSVQHGGVYVPVTEDTPPNPRLDHIDERDIVTPSGRKLTLMNPSYMNRQVHEIGFKEFGLRGHITSLNPLREENYPDEWEQEALAAFEDGVEEVSSVETIGNETFVRFMRPLKTEESCLRCHAQQGYEAGDIRGGISVSVPMEPYEKARSARLLPVAGGHLLFWVVGIVGFQIGAWRVGKLEAAKKARESDFRDLQATRLEESENSKRAMMGILKDKRRTEDESRALTERLSLATKAANIGIWDYNVKDNILIWDQSLYKMYAVEKSDFEGVYQAWRRVVHPDDLEKTEAELAAALAGEVDFDTEFRIIWPDGSIRYIRAIAGVHRDEEGNPYRMVGANWDITGTKQVEQKYKQILRTAIDGFVILDTQGNCLEVNDSFCQMIGYSRAELLSLSIQDIEAKMDQHDVEEQMARVVNKGYDQFDTMLKRKDGEIFDAQISIQFDRWSGDQVFFFVQDISIRKSSELELNRRMEELQRWHEVTLGREERIQELKDEVNELLNKMGEDEKYGGN